MKRVGALLCCLVLAGCGDPKAPPHWTTECEAFMPMTTFIFTGKVTVPITTLNCIAWREVCVWGDEYDGPNKTCAEQTP